MNFTVEFYKTADGKCPVQEFIDSLDFKMQAKILSMLEILEERGNTLRLPYSEHLDDGIFELRCKFSSNITRTLYFFYKDEMIIMTNGFVKKTQKTPRSEINIAKRRRTDYIKRKETQDDSSGVQKK